ncbi:alpha/beta hydrolase [Streptomyces sp. NPDC007162]|uniref:alpha/beta hydrolase n=1 Tax=Streptomyces sp. NPDC007162 TaxID=3156917 RepID=UPI0033D135CD
MGAPLVLRDVEYARIGSTSLCLDLYKPEGPAGLLPSLVWMHGGGWKIGDKADDSASLTPIVALGYAVASVNYRLLGDAPWPAQLHDVKAAIRWVRANAEMHGLDPDRIAAGGASAGGHLASMAGLTAGDRGLDGEVGPYTGVSSEVRAVAAMFAPTDLLMMGAPSELERQILPRSRGAELLGIEHVDDDPAAARAASPRHVVHAGAPPHLLLHGDRDAVIPIDQSRLLHDTLSAAGVTSVLMVFAGVGHAADVFTGPTAVGAVVGFLADQMS